MYLYRYNVKGKTKMISFLAEYAKCTSKTAKKTIILTNEIDIDILPLVKPDKKYNICQLNNNLEPIFFWNQSFFRPKNLWTQILLT